MNGEFLRGEVYFLLYENASTPGVCAHRPVVVISADWQNKVAPFLVVLGMTTTPKFGERFPRIESTGKSSWVKCSEPNSVPKEMVDKYMCTLTESEMASIDRGMMASLGLGDSVADETDEEIETLREEIADLEDKLDEVVIQRDTWKRMYGKAIDMLADKQESKKEPVVKKVEFVAEEQSEEPVEINTCTAEALRKIGCTPTMIHHIIEKRPYKRVEDLKTVPSITVIAYKLIESRICCVPVDKPKNVERVPKVKPQKVETPKVNINTATARELMDGVGLSTFYAYRITAHRNQNGKYESLESLLEAKKIPKDFLERYGDKLTV